MEIWYKYSIEMFKIWADEKEPRWGVDIRYYKHRKNIQDFDVYEIPNKRRNLQYLDSINDSF